MKTKLFTLALLFSIGLGTTLAQSVTRGPYLQVGTQTSVVVRWRTDVDANTRVWYGTQLDTASMITVDNASLTTEHEITISGLTANTKYFYVIGSSSTALSSLDSTYYFQTLPTAGTIQPIRICAIGDFGTGGQDGINIKNGYLNYLNGRHTDAWIWLGDNAYNDGLDAEYQANVFDIYPDVLKNHLLYPAPGNHDYGSTHPLSSTGGVDYYANFTMPTSGESGGLASGTEKYYSWDYGNVHFISLNSEEYDYTLNLDLSLTIDHDPTMITWLQNDLAANTNKDWIIAYLHQPPYSRGTHTETDASLGYYDGAIMRAVRDQIIPILESNGVDLVLNGHSHAYERSYYIHGNYGPDSPYTIDSTIVDGGTGSTSDGSPYQKLTTGPNANKGTVYAVVGCSAKTGSLLSDGQLDHPLMYASGYEGGSLVIEIDNNQLDAYLIDSLGGVYDDFTIIKSASSSNLAPIATDDVASTDTATSVIIAVQGNDNDPDGDPLTTAIVTGPGNGTATIIGTTIEYTPNPGFTGNDTIVYSVCDNGTPPLCDNATVVISVISGNVSVNSDELISTSISVFPNPFSEQLSMEYTLYKNQYVVLEIYDLDGKLVYSIFKGNQSVGTHKYTVNAEKTGLVAGAYLLQFKTEGTLKVRKTIRL